MTRAGKGRRAKILAGLAMAVMLAAGACGVKTPPYPEAATLPSKILNLTQAVTDDGEMIITWTPPKENMVGRPLKSLGGFAIEMADNVADDNYCLGCPHQYRLVDRVPAASPPPGMEMAPGPYTWRYRTQPGHVYHVRVAGVAEGGGVHPSAWTEAVVWAWPAPGSLGFSAALGDRAVELGWNRPGQGFQAEIEKQDARGVWRGLNGLDPKTGHFSDLDVEYEKTYVYRARLIRLKDQTSILGPWSPERSVRVVDVVPPNPPGYLDAALAAGGVKLSWESIAFDPDLAGYRVYRQMAGENDFKRIGPELVRENAFFDPIALTSESSVRYRVTSVDKSLRANESLPSPTVGVLLEPPVEAAPRPEPTPRRRFDERRPGPGLRRVGGGPVEKF